MADKLLRFKDVLAMDGKDPLNRSLDFDDMHVSNYMPGEDPQVNYRAYRRHRTIGVGEGGPIGESVEMEALTVSQRLRKKQQLKRIMPKIKLGRERAARRIASKEKLEKRARKQARAMILKKRLDTPAMKKRIGNIARKMFPKVRKAELDKKRKARTGK
jgi:hypothetical protein